MLPVRRWPRAAGTLARTFGARGAALRAAHELRRAAHRFRAEPRGAFDLVDVAKSDTFRIDAGRLRAATDVGSALERADRVVAGEHQAYRWLWRALPATADAWLRHPETGHAYGADAPWWTVRHLDPAAGDIKDVWEPARFGWAYDLVRGWLLTNDARYADAFARHFSAWRASSPPFRGPHWSCGQEAAIRAVALLYAEANVPLAPEVHAELLLALGDSGERIADALGYAVSQRNNHAISEAVGLLTLGARFRGAHADAERWIARGRRWFARLVEEQFAPDGWYAQHSFTYLRLAADQCVVGARVLRSLGDVLPDAAAARLRAATELLLAVVDPATGEVPNHGANDGAYVHPITTAPYRDFRPVITALAATFGVPLPADVAADPEALAWLGRPAPEPAPSLGDGVRSGPSGWAAARVGGAQVFLRAGAYETRPSHVDPLQVDVRLGGREAVVDAGTFAYNAQPPWRNGLVSAAAHNGPVLDGREPGERGPRFLWYAWPEARIVRAEYADGEAVLVAERRDGAHAAAVRRTVHVRTGEVRVADEVAPDVADEVAVRWLVHPDAPDACLRVEPAPDQTVAGVRAAEGTVAGWFSPGYGVRVPSRVVEVRRVARPGATVVTVIAPPGPAARPA